MRRYLIIGSGLIGRLTAWRLLAAGHNVTILSSDDMTGTDSAGYIAASMIAPFTEAVSDERALRDLGLQSMALWQRWLAELPEPVYFPQTGTLVVAHAGDKAEFQRYQRRALHVLDDGDFKLLDQVALQQQSPALSANFTEALWFEDEACLDNRQLFKLLGELLQQNADWRQIMPLEHIDESSLDEVCQQTLGHGFSQFDLAIDCRGNGSRQDIEDLRSVRGEVVRVHAPEVDIQHCVRLLHPRYPLYLAPRPNHEYVIGATVIESADRSPVSVRSAMELLSALYTIDKGFAEARILEMCAHCRPALPDHLPALRRQSWGFQLNGFYRHGYLLGPVMIDKLLLQLNVQQEAIAYAN
ncbi:MAG: FAD-dependent oxidoreductase [Methylophaga sp.]|nr:FAD-dependent oxidoreductase [Methylophaga sp.]